MANLLKIPNSIYDYLLFYECADKDWKSGTNKLEMAKYSPGSLIERVDWGNKGGTLAGDSGGLTKCGITHKTWSNWYNKNGKRYGLNDGADVRNMSKKGWLSFIQDGWNIIGTSANVACAIVLFQGRWGGWSNVGNCLTALKSKADIKDYEFKNSGDVYSKIADATHAFKNPMDAYQIIRNCHQQYLFDISEPGKKNAKFRVGWMRREVAPFQNDGLYIEPGIGELIRKSNTSLSLPQWKALCEQIKGKDKYVKLCSWDNMPTSDDILDFNFSTFDSENGGEGGGNGSFYQPKFSSSQRKDPHLSAHKEVEDEDGLLLGSSFNKK